MPTTQGHTPTSAGSYTREIVMDVLRNPPLARRGSQARAHLRQLRHGGLSAPNVAVRGWVSSLRDATPSSPVTADPAVQLTTLQSLGRPGRSASWFPCLAITGVGLTLLGLLF